MLTQGAILACVAAQVCACAAGQRLGINDQLRATVPALLRIPHCSFFMEEIKAVQLFQGLSFKYLCLAAVKFCVCGCPAAQLCDKDQEVRRRIHAGQCSAVLPTAGPHHGQACQHSRPAYTDAYQDALRTLVAC